MKMRVWLAVALVAVSLLTGCSGMVPVSEYEKVVAERDELLEANEALYNQLVEAYGVSNGTNSGSTSAPSGSSSTKNDDNANEDIDPILLYSDSNVEIYFSHCEKPSSFSYTGEYDIVFVVSNKTSATLSFGVNSLAINGINFSDAFGFEEVAPKSKGYFRVSTTEYDWSDISKISGSFYVADAEKKLGWSDMMYNAEFSAP